MTDEEVLAETRAFNEGLEQLVATLPPVHTVSPEETRRARRESGGIFPPPVYLPEAWWERIPGRGGEIPSVSWSRKGSSPAAPICTSTEAAGRSERPISRIRRSRRRPMPPA